MCLELGLRLGCETINSDAQYFVNDLPGVSVKQLSNTANSDLLTAKELFEKICRVALAEVKADFFLGLSDAGVQVNSTFDLKTIKLAGVESDGVGYIEFDRTCDSAFVWFKVDKIILKYATAQTVTVTITDGDTVTTQDIDVIAGFNYMSIDHTFVNPTGRVEVPAGDWETGVECLRTGFSCLSCRNWDVTGNIGYSIMSKVDKDLIFCQFKDELELPYFWKFGVHLMYEVLNSERVNFIVDLMRIQAEENIANWDSRFDKNTGQVGIYWSKMHMLLKSIKNEIKTGGQIAKPTGFRIVNSVR